MSVKNDLLGKLTNQSARIGVIGQGYVGLPISLRFCHVGFSVIGFDVDDAKVKSINGGKSYIKHIPESEIAANVKSGRFVATTDFDRLRECDAVIIAVPTPLTDKKEPDLTYVVNTADSIVPRLRRGQVISLESTTYPGTTREILLSRFDKTGLKAGSDYFLVFSPEREDPGNPTHKIHDIPKVIGGMTANCSEIGVALYSQIIAKIVPVTSPETAEMTKLLENIFRSVNIALVNELKMLTDKMGINIWEVIAASSTKPFGFMPFYPGPGLGGHCIPIDPFYLSWKAKEYDFYTRFIELAGEINTSVPYWVVNKTAEILNTRSQCLNGAKILILGVAYKKNVDDMRESPALHIMEILESRGAKITYHDPYIPALPRTRKYDYHMASAQLTEKMLSEFDAVMIITDHDNVDYSKVVANAKIVIDTRNATNRLQGPKANVYLA